MGEGNRERAKKKKKKKIKAVWYVLCAFLGLHIYLLLHCNYYWQGSFCAKSGERFYRYE